MSGGLDPADFAPVLKTVLEAGDVASLLLRLGQAPDEAVRHAADRLRPVAQDRGVAFLLDDRPDLVAATGADGVHLDREDADLAAARRRLGPDAIVGASCATSRHRAMVAAEQGADYVAFGGPATDGGEILSVVEWWSALMTVPSVAFVDVMPAKIAPLVRAGADFLAVGERLWDWPDGPAAALRAYLAAIAAAQESGASSAG